MSKPLRVLLLEDSEMDALLMLRALQKGGYDVSYELMDTAASMRAALAQPWDIILSDHNMQGFDSLTALTILHESGLDIPFIIISGAIGEELAVEAMKAGASDYLMKDKLARLVPAIERELKEAKERDAKRKAQEDLEAAKLELEASNQLLRAYTRKLEQSNKELAQFATVVSHDLQAPLRKVSLFADFLTSAQNNSLSDEQRDYLDRICIAVQRMQLLVSDLLELSRINRTSHGFTQVDLAAVLESVTDDLQVQLEALNGRIELGPLMTLEADPVQMQQLLQNLMENALKFHRPDCPPVVTVSAVPIGSGENARCRITVADNGIGFNPEHAELIFEVFQRLHGVGQYEGTGVGLAIVKKIVERHSGAIQAGSEPDQGSRFIIELPLTQHQPPAQANNLHGDGAVAIAQEALPETCNC